MSIRFISGRSGSGKTTMCLREIGEKLSREPFGHPLIMLVPEQATFQAEYALVQTPGVSGTIRVQALSFRRLAFRVLQETGGTARIPITETGKKMMLYRIVRSLNPKLRMFRHAEEQMGAIDNLHEMLNEFKRYLLTPDRLARHADTYAEMLRERSHLLSDKLHDLALIFERFETELSGHYVDSEDLLTLLSARIWQSRYLREADIWIDGFHGFTPQEYAVIGELMKTCRRVTVSLCADCVYGADDAPDELHLFYPTALSMVKLQRMAEELGVEREAPICLDQEPLPRFANSPLLRHLEKTGGEFSRRDVYVPDASVQDALRPDEQLQICSAVHRRAEVEAAAREIVRLVRDKHYRWRDIAVAVRDAEGYQHLLETVFSDFEIPYFIDQKHSVAHHPLVELIRSALEVVNGNWRYEAVFRAVKTDFFAPEGAADFRTRMDRLENYVLAFGIQGGKWTSAERWKYRLYRSLEDESAAEMEEANLDLLHGERMLIVAPLKAFQDRLRKADNVKGMTEAVYRLLADLRVPATLQRWSDECLKRGEPEKAREHAAIWDHVIDVFDQLVEMLGDEQIACSLFSGILETGLDSIKLGLVPPALDQVLIGSIDRSRSSGVKCCFLLGANDGVLPSRMEEGGVLSEHEREWLEKTGLTLAPGNKRRLLDERFIIYTALSIPSERLWISYPLADEEGRALLPSQIIRRLTGLFPQIRERLLIGEPDGDAPLPEQLEYISRPAKALSYLTVQLRQWKKGMPVSAIWWELYNWYCSHPQLRHKLELLRRGLFHTNRESPLSVRTSKQLYGEQLKTSVSRMEKFASCPFSHFVSYGLRLRERSIYRLEAPDVGQLFHAALRIIVEQMRNDPALWARLSAGEVTERAFAAVELLSPRLQNEILFSTNRYQYIAWKLKMTVGRAAVVLGEHARRSGFVPYGLELDFGGGSSVPSLRFDLADGCSMEIVGRIDRVDRAEDDDAVYFRIVDYKSGVQNLRIPELYYGLSMQMLTYLDVMVSYAEQTLTKQVIPAGALYFHVHNPLLGLNGTVSREQAEQLIFKKFKMKGLILSDPKVIGMMDSGMERRSDIVPAGVSDTGQVYKNSSVYTLEEWRALRSHLRQSMKSIGSSIIGGQVDIQPYRLGKKTPCAFCSYRPVCQFEPQIEGNEYRQLPMTDKDELWGLMSGTFEAAASSGNDPFRNGGKNDAADRA